MADHQPPSAPTDIATIKSYHAHIYYDQSKTRDRAACLRERLMKTFPEATFGSWNDNLVGPHSQSMFRIAFPREHFARLFPWLMLHRDGLTVLVHPETGNEHADHAYHAAWLGKALPLKLDNLRRKDAGEHPPLTQAAAD